MSYNAHVPKHIVLAYVFLHIMGHNAQRWHRDGHVMNGGEEIAAYRYNLLDAFRDKGLEYLKNEYAKRVGHYFGRGYVADE